MAGIGWQTEATGLLSSWTPDFTNSGGNNWDLRTGAASGKTKFQNRFNERKELRLKGFVVDVIKRMGSISGLDCGGLRRETWVMEAEDQFRVPGKNDEEFRRTLNADKRVEADCEMKADGMETYLESFRSVLRRQPGGVDHEDGATFHVLQIHMAQFSSSAMIRAIHGRRLCETDNGRLGLVPRGAEVGDLVCVVRRGQSPLLYERPRKLTISDRNLN